MTAHLGGAAGEPLAAGERPTLGYDSTGSVVADMRGIFAAADAVGFVAAWEVGRPGDAVEVDADRPVTVASMIKIVITLAFARGVAGGQINPRDRPAVHAGYRLGGQGRALA